MASILIIDDQDELVQALARIARSQGHTVFTASDGKTALRHFAGQPTDVVVTDIYMPEMDGIEFIMRLKEAFPETRVIAMSGGGIMRKENVLGAASMLGAEAVLEKPFDAADFIGTLERVLSSSA